MWLKQSIRQCLTDQFRQNWHDETQNCSKATNYKLFKDTLEFQNYFEILNKKASVLFCKFRTGNHKLPIETGRWNNIDRSDRKCMLCNEQIGDEFHYILECNALSQERSNLISGHLFRNPNILKFKETMITKKKVKLYKLCKFIKIINKKNESS